MFKIIYAKFVISTIEVTTFYIKLVKYDYVDFNKFNKKAQNI